MTYIKDRNITKSFKAANSLLDKISESVKKYHFKDDSDLIRYCIDIGCEFLEKGDYFRQNPNEAKKFLDELSPEIRKLKEKEAVLVYFKNLDKKTKEVIFYQLDQERKSELINEQVEAEKYKIAPIYGYEVKSKIGYISKAYVNDMSFYRPIDPKDSEWKTLTRAQKYTLLADQRKKLLQNEENKIEEHYLLRIRKTIEEISKAIDVDKESKDSSM